MPTHIKTIHLTASINPDNGGTARVVLDLVRDLNNKLNTSTSTIRTLASRQNIDYLAKNPDHIQFIRTDRPFGPPNIGFSPAMQKWATSLNAADYDILHQHGIWTALSRVSQTWQRTFNKPTLISPHGSLMPAARSCSKFKKHLAWQAWEHQNLTAATCLHATSYSEAKSFRLAGLQNPIAIIPNGVSDDWLQQKGNGTLFRQRYNIPANTLVFLFLSRIHPIKGLSILIKAFSTLVQNFRNVFLVIAGPDEKYHKAELQSQITSLNLNNFICFIGPLLDQDKLNAYDAADVFVLPSHSENFGLVVAEAMAQCLPVITTTQTPWQDIQKYQCGWYVKDSVKELFSALQQANSLSKVTRQEMGSRGKNLIEEKYSSSVCLSKFVQLYMWLMEESQKPLSVIM